MYELKFHNSLEFSPVRTVHRVGHKGLSQEIQVRIPFGTSQIQDNALESILLIATFHLLNPDSL